MTQFQTVDQLQATIASQAAQIERLREAITDEDGEMEIRRLRMQLIDIYRERNLAIAEVDRLREALTTIAGPPERDPDLPPIYQPRWSVEQCRYIARAALQPKENNIDT